MPQGTPKIWSPANAPHIWVPRFKLSEIPDIPDIPGMGLTRLGGGRGGGGKGGGGKGGSGGGGKGGGGKPGGDGSVQTIWMDDKFTTADAAPLASAAEPTGIRKLNDTGNRLSTSSARLVVATGGTAWTDPQVAWEDANDAPFTRTGGRAFYWKGLFNAPAADSQNLLIGWATAGAYPRAQADTKHAFLFRQPGNNATSGLITYDGSGAGSAGQKWTSAQEYELLVVLRPTAGAYALIKGGEYADWTLYHVFPEGTDASMVPVFINGGGSFTALSADRCAVIDLQDTAWATQYGLVSASQIGNLPVGTQLALGTSRCFLEFTITTVPSAGNVIRIAVFYEDSDNYYFLETNNAGKGTFHSRIAGVESLLTQTSDGWFDNPGQASFIALTQDNDTPDGAFLERCFRVHRAADWPMTSITHQSVNTGWNQDARVITLGGGAAIQDFRVYPVNPTVTFPAGF